jgi:diguanylate cyclase (GGDEF)-like protein
MTEEGRRVLVIDDNAVIRKLTKTLLSKSNYVVMTADNGREGINIAETFNPQVILLDVMMPDIDGYKVCEELKSNDKTKDIPVVMVTSLTESVDKIRGLEIGAADYVTKPFNHGELLARVATHVKLKTIWDELQEKNRMLEDLCRTDGLTNLSNYRHFIEKLSYEFARSCRYGLSLCCAMLDIDHFKKVNDNYGHQAGDIILKSVSKIIIKNIREIDIAARYGGEEFGLILPHTKLEDAVRICNRIRENIESYGYEYNNLMIKVTISIGLCCMSDIQTPTFNDLIKYADKSLYDAKKSGRNRVESFNIKR